MLLYFYSDCFVPVLKYAERKTTASPTKFFRADEICSSWNQIPSSVLQVTSLSNTGIWDVLVFSPQTSSHVQADTLDTPFKIRLYWGVQQSSNDPEFVLSLECVLVAGPSETVQRSCVCSPGRDEWSDRGSSQSCSGCAAFAGEGAPSRFGVSWGACE